LANSIDKDDFLMNNQPKTKQCRHCGRRKPAKQFPRAKKMKDGLSSWCRKCHAEAVRRTLRKKARRTT
jgi:superfamily II helicase